MARGESRATRLDGDEVVSLVTALGAVVATAEHPEELIARTLDVLAEATGWPQAEAWVLDDGLLQRAPGTVSLTPQAGAFNDFHRDRRYAKGEGLPGRAWQSAAAVVLPSLGDVPWYGRGDMAGALGFTAAAAVPVAGPEGLEFVVALHGAGTVDAARLGLLLTVASAQLRGTWTRLRDKGPRVTSTDVRLGAITAGARVAVWEWRPGDEHMLAGPAVRDLLGLRASEPLPTFSQFLDTIVAEDRLAVRQAIRTTLESAGERVPFTFEYRWRMPGGEIRWFFVQGTLHRSRNGGDALMRAAMQDITHLRLGEQRLAGALRAAGMAWWELDPATFAIVPSPELAPMLGLARGAALTSLAALLVPVHADDRARVGDALAGVTRDGHAQATFRIVLPSGAERWLEATATHTVHVTGGPARVAGVLRDVTEQRHAAVQLRESEEHHRALFDRHPLPVLLLDEESDALLDANPAACALYGLDRARLVAVTKRMLLAPDDVAAYDAERARGAGRRGRGGGRPRTADGRVLDVLVTSEPVTHRGRAARMAVVTDITARLAMERALEETAQRFRTVIDHIEDGVLLLDMDGGAIVWNPAAERILGLSGDVLRGFRPADPRWSARDEAGAIVPTSELPVHRARRDRCPVTQLIEITRGDGSRRWIRVHAVPIVDRDGDPQSVVATFTDITESRAAAREIEESESRYRLLAEKTRDLVCRHAPDGRFTYVSPSSAALLGWAPAELEGRDAFAYVHPDDAARIHAQVFRPVLAGERALPPATYRFRRHDGSWTWFETQASPVIDDDGTVTAIVTTSRDVSERRALEEQLRHAAKMEAVGTLAGGIAHDFANVLAIVRGAASTLTETVAVDDVVLRTEIEAIEGATARGQALTRQLLGFARRTPDQPVTMVLDDAVRRAVPLLRRLLRGDQRLVAALEAPTVAVTADVAELELALMNIVSNARAAMPDGGEVTVATSVVTLDDDGAAAIPPLRAGAYVRLTVRDTGTGMSESVRARLFEPFFTTKPVGEGTGLGLATSYGVVRRARGTITVDSAPGDGATFTIWLPAATSASSAPASPAGTWRPPAGSVAAQATVAADASSRRVVAMVVDDEEVVRTQMVRTLRRDGIDVIEAASAEEALTLLARGGAGVSMLITDFMLPGASGRELVERATSQWPHLETLLVSAYMRDEVTRQALQRTRTRFLAKPYDLRDFLRTVRETLLSPRQEQPDEAGQPGG
jgi:PAS domain S-box-containing protein